MSWREVIDFNCTNKLQLSENFSFEITKDYTKLLPFLNNNYNANKTDYMLNYTEKHLEWYFKDEDYTIILLKHYNVIIGSISGKTEEILINKIKTKVFEINFLCITYSYRKYHLLNYLISEISRISINKKILYGFYISNDKHNIPLIKVNYFQYYSKVHLNLDNL